MSELLKSFTQSMSKIMGTFPPRKLGLAVSGGVDSIALTSLASQWAKPRGIALNAYIADHKLRKNSSEEAQSVSKYLEDRFGITSRIITLKNLKELTSSDHTHGSRIEEVARHARRTAFAENCTADDVSHLLMAHHLNDQLELFIQRLLKGSSWFGLAGMRACSPLSMVTRGNEPSRPVNLVRPLLHTSKSELLQWCSEQNIKWWEDPTNEDIFLTERNLIRRLYKLGQEPEAFRPQNLVPLLNFFGLQRDKVLNSAANVHKHMMVAGQLKHRPTEGTTLLHITKDVRALPLTTLSELLLRIIAPISPSSEDKILTRRRRLDKVSKLLKSNEYQNVDMNVLGVRIKNHEKSKDRWVISRELPRNYQRIHVDVFKATQDWCDWTLVDNRWFMRWKLLDKEGNNSTNRYFNTRFVPVPETVLSILCPKLPKPVQMNLRKLIYTHPMLMWDDPQNPHLIEEDKIIGFPTLGIIRGLDIEVQPKTCVF